MDSYEFYLLFHKDSTEFINALSDKNDEILISLEKLLENSKISYGCEKESCLKKVWTLVQNEKDFNERLERIFKMLIKQNKLSSDVRMWIFENLQKLDKGHDCNSEALLKVVRNVTEVFISNQELCLMFEQIANILIDLLFKEKPHHAEIIDVLQRMMVGNESVNKFICEKILEKSHERSDQLGFANLCYFFDEICKLNLELNVCELLSKYMESSEPLPRKQGLFLIKCLIQRKKFAKTDEESFKKFTIIVEALQESPHLILPTLKLIESLKFSDSFTDFIFLLLHMVITHESAPVKNWGLNYLLSNRKLQLNDKQIIIVLSALNSTCLFDPDEDSIDNQQFEKFIKCNFNAIFRLLTKINWISVPIYRITQVIVKEILLKDKREINEEFILTLQNQTDLIPKRSKNLVIRSGIKSFYAKALLHLKGILDLSMLVKCCDNIFVSEEKLDDLSEIFRELSTDDLHKVLSNEPLQPEFIRFILMSFCSTNELSKIFDIWKTYRKHRLSLMEAVCEVAKVRQSSIEFPFHLIGLCITELTKATESKEKASLQEILIHGLKFAKSTRRHDLSIFLKDAGLETIHFQGELSFDDVEVLLELYDDQWTQHNYKRSSTVLIQTHLFLRLIDQLTYIDTSIVMNILKDIKSILEDCDTEKELSHFIQLVEKLSEMQINLSDEHLQNIMAVIDKLSLTIINFSDRNKFVVKFVEMLLLTLEKRTNDFFWNNNISATLEDFIEKLNENERLDVTNVIIQHLEKFTSDQDQNNSMKDFMKRFLVTRMIETDMMTREQRIEMTIGCEIEKAEGNINESMSTTRGTYNNKKSLRLRTAKALANFLQDEFEEIIEGYMEDFTKASKKKPRYFPNAWIHRMKLHCLQPMVLCSTLSERTIEILIDELLYINNQPNVTYLIEIILAKHGVSVIDFLTDEALISKLKSPALKSIFVISVMQLKKEDAFTLLAENFFGIAEVKLEALHDIIMPFTMGQNYGVRSNAQAAIILIYKHVKSLFGARESLIMSRIAKSCEVINESVKFKNASKFLEKLKQDFRLTLKFDYIWTIDVFYHHIPLLTKMSFEEIIEQHVNGRGIDMKIDSTKVKIAVENETEALVMEDEIAVPILSQPATASADNLQQKYLPQKYQIPGEKIMKMLPSIFQDVDGAKEFRLKRRSSLTVVASLVSHAPNLGGLARTCEIFGVSNYVIESLKLTENSDFKALSKTAEKWMKISEVKQWNLFDYLMGMKLQGFKIVGAEQSGKSISLVNAKIPEKSVLLLGNENEGIPPNLMSLLDMTIELPQTGVVRSLNVHVTGAIVIWEYAKQHLFKAVGT